MQISEVYNQCCIEFMKGLPDKFMQLAIPDPNYGIGEFSKNHASRNTPIRQNNGLLLRAPRTTYKKSGWDDTPPPDKYFNELFRTTQNQIIWGSNYFSQIVGTPFKPPRREFWPEFMNRYPKGWIIWDKVNGGNDFNDCELAWTSFDRPTYILQYMWNGMMQGKSLAEPTIVQGNKRLNEKRIHPTQKPVLINRKLIIDYANIGDKIYDSHMGSQSSRIAAWIEGFDYYGNEIDESIFKDGTKRFEQQIIKQELQFA